jgi:hypothetical protein
MSELLSDLPAQGKGHLPGQQPKNPKFASGVVLLGTVRHRGHASREYKSKTTGSVFGLILEDTEDRSS